MLEGILQGLFQWIYGMFLDLIAYCANALLRVMTTDLQFWETSVPVAVTLYQIFVLRSGGYCWETALSKPRKRCLRDLGLKRNHLLYYFSEPLYLGRF